MPAAVSVRMAEIVVHATARSQSCFFLHEKYDLYSAKKSPRTNTIQNIPNLKYHFVKVLFQPHPER